MGTSLSIDHRLDLIQGYWGTRNMQDELTNMRKKVKGPREPRKPKVPAQLEQAIVAEDSTTLMETMVTHVGDQTSALATEVADIAQNKTI
jgi:hypothetical protein